MHTTRRSILALMLSLGLLAACAGDGGPSATRSTVTPSVSDDDGDDGDDVDVDPERSTDGDDDPTSDSNDSSDDDSDDDGTVGGGDMFRLAPFADCSMFLTHVKDEARDRVGPYGLDGSGYPWGMFVDVAADVVRPEATEAPAATTPAAAPTVSRAVEESAGFDQAAGGTLSTPDSGDAAASGESSVTGTNTQEAGVDEPDIVKSDGERIVIVSDNVLTVVDITGEQPVVTGRLTIPDSWGHQLFLAGNRAVLLSNSGSWSTPMPIDVEPVEADVEAEFAPADDMVIAGPMGQMPAATITEVDLSDPAAPAISATLTIEGQYLNARVIDDRLLLAVSSGPQWMPWLFPQSPAGEERAREANQALIDDSTLSDWVPQYELEAGGESSTGDLLDCSRLNRPAEFSGFDVISVLGLDLGDGLAGGFDPAQAVGVLAGGQTVYASLDRFFVATTKWSGADVVAAERLADWSDDYETDLHSFAITPDAPVEYVASGSVPGTLLNSFSLDEQDGYLRVLTTDGSPWDQSDLSETRLTVFAEDGDLLTPVGEVGGLGKGEALYSARLIGDRGFAVTFRQVDPFYVLDLSDPTAPQVSGELKIPGFSTYLHPVGDHRVLGVGRAATEDGVVTGLKLSLFDVSDAANPVEISTWTLDNAQSAAEYDHHAFQMIGSTAILPVQSSVDGFNGAIVFDIGDTINELGRITHVDPTEQPTSECRELVEGDLPESSPLYWLSVDTYTRTQLCTSDQASGYGSWYCDSVTVDQFPTWFGVGSEVADELAAVNGGELDRIEMCYPTDSWTDAIQRSLVIDGTLWTLSTSSLHANDLATLEPLAAIDLR